LEDNFCHFVCLDVDGIGGFLVSSLFGDFPVNLAHADCGTRRADKRDRGVPDFEFSGVIEDLDLTGEFFTFFDGTVRFEDHDITDTRHVFLCKTFDVQTDIVTSIRNGL